MPSARQKFLINQRKLEITETWQANQNKILDAQSIFSGKLNDRNASAYDLEER
jgi:hypothetical protein